MLSDRNLLEPMPVATGSERFETLFESPGVLIERIDSSSHTDERGFWHDQDHDEWVAVLKGEALLSFEGGRSVEMKSGDHLLISAHTKHRVERTTGDTVWLAVHVRG
jgi:cupin 2 domain-containing protein